MPTRKVGRESGSEPFEMYYELRGSDSAPCKIVLIMGWGAGVNAWFSQFLYFDQFPEQYQLLAMDNRGIGRSEAPSGLWTVGRMASDIIELLDHLRWDKVHVVGLSMGGMIAQRLAIRLVERYRLFSLALISTHSGGLRSFPPVKGLVKLARSVGYKPEKIIGHTLDIIATKEYLSSEVGNDLVENAGKVVPDWKPKKDHSSNREYFTDFLLTAQPLEERAIGGSALSSYKQIPAILLNHISKKELQDICRSGIPAFLSSARYDVLIAQRNIDFIQKYLRPYKYKQYEAGHCLNIECSQEFNNDLREHIDWAQHLQMMRHQMVTMEHGLAASLLLPSLFYAGTRALRHSAQARASASSYSTSATQSTPARASSSSSTSSRRRKAITSDIAPPTFTTGASKKKPAPASISAQSQQSKSAKPAHHNYDADRTTLSSTTLAKRNRGVK